MNFVIVEVEPGADEASSVENAMRWLGISHPGVSARADRLTVEITGAHPVDQLQRFWEISLLNEQLVSYGAADRDSLRESLIR